MSKSRALFALTLLTHLAACADEHPSVDQVRDASAATVADSGALDPLEFDAFDQALEAAIAKHNEENPTVLVRGASAVVVDRTRGVVHQKGYGAYSADRLYLIASSSKILSVGVLMRLADEGKLDLDAPISKYLSDWGSFKQNVTVAQLVSNSSGLPALDEIAKAATSMDPAALTRINAHICQYSERGKLSECGRSIYTDPLPENNRQPDVEFRYGGSQWQLAGAVAEKVSGESWAELVDETYAACDVPSLGYTNQFGRQPFGYPTFFEADADKLPPTENPSIEGGAYVTAPDYGKLLWMHLRGGKCGDTQVLSEAAVARMQKDRVGGKDGYAPEVGTRGTIPGYGLGWWVDDAQGYIADPGAYGAYPVIDAKRGYAYFIVIELTTEVGAKLALATKPVLDEIFSSATK